MIIEKSIHKLAYLVVNFFAEKKGKQLVWINKELQLIYLKDFVIVLNLN